MNKSDARVRAFIIDVLKKNKALTEREVKAAVRRGLKLGDAPLSAGVIRKVRRALGIDRPRAIAYVKSLLAKNPILEANKIIAEVGERFGIRLSAPDVSRLRSAGARKRRAAKANATPAPSRPAGRAKAAPMAMKKSQRSYGAISVTYEAKGVPEDVAHFFRSLAE